MTLTHASQAAWIELDAEALEKNLTLFRSLLSVTGAGAPPKLGLVLKGNAYGHGLEPVLRRVHAHADLLYVISPVDALAVRALETKEGLRARRVIVTGAVSGEEAVALSREGIELTLADRSWTGIVQALRAAVGPPRAQVHVFVDSGLGREGFGESELSWAVELLEGATDVLTPVGVLSHFSNTEDVTEQSYARQQMEVFARASQTLSAAFPQARLMRHFAASAAALVLPDARYDAVRVGISLYGLWPSPETKLSVRVVHGQPLKLEPVMSLRCHSQAVKWLAAGSYVGYGCTYRCDQRTRVAVFPVGYFDGYPRLVSGKAHVLVDGQRCRVLGRVMMNHLVVDVTHVPESGDSVVATLLGRDGQESVSVELLAEWAQTISYEIVTRMGPHLERRILAPATSVL